MKKTYVKVLVEYSESGQKRPVAIFWDNGKKYEIEKIIDVKQKPSFKAGGLGERFEIKIENKTTYLFFENGQWFVEEK